MRNEVSKALSHLKDSVKNFGLSLDVERLWMRFGISTFNKTRFDSHISFIRTCLKERVIPNGFQLHFHHGNSSRFFNSKCRKTVDNCSFQLMRNVLNKYSKDMIHLSKDRENQKSNLQQLSSEVEWRSLSTVVHSLNKDLYNSLLTTKNKKMSYLLPPVEENIEVPSNQVVKIPENVLLSEDEEKLLQKGLSFIPKTQQIDPFRTLEDTEQYFRKIRLKAFFANSPDDENQNVPEVDEFTGFKNKWSRFTPKPGQFDAVDTYIKNCKKEIKEINFQQKCKSDKMSPKDLEALRSLKQRTDIVIKPADKGGAVVVWAKDAYITEGIKQLSDQKFYKALDEDTTGEIQKDIQKEIDRLIKDGSLKDSAKHLLVASPRCSRFYLLPKIHKAGNPGRPVVSNISCPTYNISKFLSNTFKPIIQKSSSYIRDSTHLLQKLNEFTFKEDSPNNVLFTMDVKGLYTNIPNADGLKALKYHLEREPHQEIPTDTLIRLAELVLTVNCMEFNGRFYSQVSGTMMGTPFGVEYSCSFMIYQETKLLERYNNSKPVLYLRYIDDIFGISEMPRDQLDLFMQAVKDDHQALQYTETVGREVNMLDTTLKVEGTKITSTLFTKSTDSHSYLLFDSSHPHSCKTSIPFSQFLRLRRICSDDKDFESKSKWLSKFFSNSCPKK